MVQFTLARALRTPLGPPPGMYWSHIYGDSKSLGAAFLTYSERARPVLPYGTIYLGLRASNPARPALRECFWSHIYGDSKSLGAKFLTYSDRARPVLPYGTIYFGSRASNRTRPLSGNVLIPYLRGQQVPFGRLFNIFWQSASSSTLWYNWLWLGRFQPRSPPPPVMFWSHIYGDSKSLGAEFLTYSEIARPVLPYGTIYFGSRASNPAQPPIRECFNPIFTETASPLAPKF